MPSSRGRLVNRDFARLWYGQAISTVGDFVFDTTLVLWVGTVLGRGKAWAPAAVSGVMPTGLAVLVVGPLAGVFVDRWNRRRTMMRTEVVRAVLVGALAVLSLLPTRSLPTAVWLTVIYVVVFVLNGAGQFFSPARFATIGDIVTGEVDQARAAGIGQATTATAAIIGPPLAAPLLFLFGVRWALLFNTLSYVVSYVAIRSIRTAAASTPAEPGAGGAAGLRREFVAGLRFFAGNRLLMSLLGIAVIAQCGTGALNTLGVFFVTGNLHAPSRLYGFMSTALGVGAILGSLAAGRVVRRIGARTTTWLGLGVCGLLVVLYARQTTFPAGLVLLGALSIPVAMLNTAMTPLLLQATPQQYLGRMTAVFNPVSEAASMLSVVAAGWLASTALRGFHADLGGLHLGPIDTIFTAAGLLIVLAAGFGAVVLPRPAPAAPVAAPAEPAVS